MMSANAFYKVEAFVSQWKFTRWKPFDMVEKRMVARRPVLQSAISTEAFHSIVRFQIKESCFSIYCDVYWKS